ncbi:MAG TPA: Xaa-Pro peptidase family protein [Syntrophomonadaceae bacterium]|nr:Xaa-Pro peptidase family protein [Syntrophomonadaceae bacterium]
MGRGQVIQGMQRINHLRQILNKKNIDALLVTKGENIYYLSHFTGGSDARLLVDFQQCLLFTDARYLEQARAECPGWIIIEEKPPGQEQLAQACSGISRLGVESHHITYQFYRQLCELLSAELFPFDHIVEMLRVRKEDEELTCLQESARIGDEVFDHLLTIIQPGASEVSLANQITNLLREKGCSRESFDTIVLAGKHAALPHGHPRPESLCSGDMLTMDFGGFFRYYSGDMTRTVAVKEASQRLRDLYQRVLEAQQTALAAVKVGASCSKVDGAARDILRKAGLDQYFQHSTGHGLGLEVHEYPPVSQRSQAILQENMVITIEPGIYIPGWGGIRIEDAVVVKSNGCQVLTHSNKDLLIV